MDQLYDLYVDFRSSMLGQNATLAKLASIEDSNEDILFYALETAIDEGSDERDETDTIPKQELSKRVLDLNSAIGLLSFLYSQLDVVTALSVVANMEKRAQYDPQFRTSFPGFLRENSWFL